MMHRIMLVDDEPNILRALERLLSGPQRALETFTDAEQALQRAHTATFDLVLSDYRMPGMDGIAFLNRFKAMQPDAMRLILSGHTDLNALLAGINEAEIYRFIAKPWQDYELRQTIDQALAQRHVLVENRRLAEQVRRQQAQLGRQEAALRELERRHPEIARVVWGEDGSVLLDDDAAE